MVTLYMSPCNHELDSYLVDNFRPGQAIIGKIFADSGNSVSSTRGVVSYLPSFTDHSLMDLHIQI